MLLKTFLAIVTFILTVASANGQGSYSSGVKKGKIEAEKLWKSNGSSCSSVYSFGDDIADLKTYYPTNTSSNKKNTYNRGVRSGADEVLKKYQKKCLEDDSKECTDLGANAAQEIAFEYCEIYSFAPSSYDYEQACRQVAYGLCKGKVGSYVKSECGKSLTTSKLLSLQNKCKGQVDYMTGGGN